jgi:phage gpG-like protein
MATAMAKYIMERTRDQTLRRRSHGPGQYYRHHLKGDPPAYASGRLARAMWYTPASGGLVASALVGNRSEYGRILEFGCVITPVNKKKMHWVDSAGSWYHDYLEVPAHPFLSRTVADAIADGSLTRVAIEAFLPYDP